MDWIGRTVKINKAEVDAMGVAFACYQLICFCVDEIFITLCLIHG